MLENLKEKQIRDRMRFLSDKMETIWEKISPELNEFDELRLEFEQLFIELDKRGKLDGISSQSGDVNRESSSERSDK